MKYKTCTHCGQRKKETQFEPTKRQCRPCRWQIRKERMMNKRRDDFNRLVNWPAPDLSV
jgi:hypothetical protein